VALFIYALTTQNLLPALFDKPFIFAIMSVILAAALAFAVVVGTLGAVVGRWSGGTASGLGPISRGSSNSRESLTPTVVVDHPLDRPEINMSSIKVGGVGGLGMLAGVGIMALALPEVRGFMLITLAGGTILGAVFIAARSRRHVEPPSSATLFTAASEAKVPTESHPEGDSALKLKVLASI
jgi:hypothetical protein